MADLPNRSLDVSPVIVLPFTLNTKVRSTVPNWVSAVPFHVPLTSAAIRTEAKTAVKTTAHFIVQPPANGCSSPYFAALPAPAQARTRTRSVRFRPPPPPPPLHKFFHHPPP